MKLPRPTSDGVQFTEAELRVNALTAHIMHKISQEDERLAELTAEEQVVYCGERLSSQINMDGLASFFDYSVALLYEPVLRATKVIEAERIGQALERAKVMLLGDGMVTAESLEAADEWQDAEEWNGRDVSEIEGALEDLEDEEMEEEFHEKLQQYVLNLFDRGGFELESA